MASPLGSNGLRALGEIVNGEPVELLTALNLAYVSRDLQGAASSTRITVSSEFSPLGLAQGSSCAVRIDNEAICNHPPDPKEPRFVGLHRD